MSAAAAELFRETNPERVQALLAGAPRVLAMPQGGVLPAQAEPIARALGISAAEVLAIAAGLATLKDRRVLDGAHPNAPSGDDHTGTRALLAAGAEPARVLYQVPLFGGSLEAELIEETLAVNQRHYNRLVELGFSTTRERSAVQRAVSALARLFAHGEFAPRGGWGKRAWHADTPRPADHDRRCSPRLGGMPDWWQLSMATDDAAAVATRIANAPRFSPTCVRQVWFLDGDRLALVYPYVALVLERRGDGWHVVDAFATGNVLASWAHGRKLAFGLPPEAVREDGKWLLGPIPQQAPEVVPGVADDETGWPTTVLRRDGHEAAVSAWASAQLRRTTADARYGVVTYFHVSNDVTDGLAHAGKLMTSRLVDLTTGAFVDARYAAVLHRARAVSFVDGVFGLAVNGNVLRDGHRVARYAGATAASFDPVGERFAWATSDGLEVADLRDGQRERLELAVLHPLVRPALGLDAFSEAAFLWAAGAAPLTGDSIDAILKRLAEARFLGESREFLQQRISEVGPRAALSASTWPLVPSVRSPAPIRPG